MNKKAQAREALSILIVLAVVWFFLKLVMPAISAASTGNSTSLTDALIPLIIFAMFFEFIRRFFR